MILEWVGFIRLLSLLYRIGGLIFMIYTLYWAKKLEKDFDCKLDYIYNHDSDAKASEQLVKELINGNLSMIARLKIGLVVSAIGIILQLIAKGDVTSMSVLQAFIAIVVFFIITNVTQWVDNTAFKKLGDPNTPMSEMRKWRKASIISYAVLIIAGLIMLGMAFWLR